MDDILGSLEGIKRAAPNPELFNGILSKIAASEKLQLVRAPYIGLAAACLALLICANVTVFSQQSQKTVLPSAYQIEQVNFNIYGL